MNNKISKDNLRKEVSSLKKNYTPQQLLEKSDEVFSVLELTGEFRKAKNIMVYNSLSDEVSTLAFINRWCGDKEFYLPVVKDDDLLFRKYTPCMEYQKSELGISEPVGADFLEYHKVDMIIVPGRAFDRKMNRMGRGKGYYDRFLPKLKAKKIGICFDFQLFENIPCEKNDIRMDMIVSENELIW